MPYSDATDDYFDPPENFLSENSDHSSTAEKSDCGISTEHATDSEHSSPDEIELRRIGQCSSSPLPSSSCSYDNGTSMIRIEALSDRINHCNLGREILRSWWKRLRRKKTATTKPELEIMKVKQNRKKRMEFTALYVAKEIRAHRGCIWTMKFSPDCQYLATGGEDGVVRIWQVEFASSVSGNFIPNPVRERRFSFLTDETCATVVVPQKIFRIQQSPLQDLRGHTGDVLDLTWSTSNNHLLSSSVDATVRLWTIGSDEFSAIFHHRNYVTCVQYDPVNEDRFISGSIDGKVRIWSVSMGRVVNWVDAKQVITAVCYRANGFTVGSVHGACRFYSIQGEDVTLYATMQIGRKKNPYAITSMKSCPGRSDRILVTSADSKLRILDNTRVVCQYKGLWKSGSQLSASFTSDGRHIVSVAADNRVYVWNYDGGAAETKKTIRSCEYFSLADVSVAVPWSSCSAAVHGGGIRCLSSHPIRCLDEGSYIRPTQTTSSGRLDGNCVYCRSATWPEQDLHARTSSDLNPRFCGNYVDAYSPARLNHMAGGGRGPTPTWGLVILTGSSDGAIRTFHNYGLPIRI